jgi:hypothetical protein
MTNILTDKLPVTVEIGGRDWKINSDFRACLKVILAFEDVELTGHEKQIIMLTNLYPVLPDDVQAAFQEANLFLNGGRINAGSDDDAPRLYSFAKDADLIFSAFQQTHGIDLQAANMHWWKFLALFMDLGADTAFCNLVNLRRRVKSGKATKDEKQAARDMGEVFEVPEVDTRTVREKELEAEFLKAVTQGKK